MLYTPVLPFVALRGLLGCVSCFVYTMKQYINPYGDIISIDNLLEAWKEFLCGKRNRKDVAYFQVCLMDQLFSLHRELQNNTYIHGSYRVLRISDPKPRVIHIAPIRDRLLHHALYRKLYPYFERKFEYDSYSCRNWKGTHRAINRFRKFFQKISKNNTKQCWVLKCDIKKFFASIDHTILLSILQKHISNPNTYWLCERIIRSFSARDACPSVAIGRRRGSALDGETNKGLPLGNLTSQLFANVYMNEFDQFVKHILKAKHYIRYADDFVFLSHNKKELENLIPVIQTFLREKLKLSLHENKLFIKTIGSGVDFLGWIHFPDYRVLRTATKRRMLRRIQEFPTAEMLNSYIGLLKHGNAWKLKEVLCLCPEL